MPIPKPPEEFPIINSHTHIFTKDHVPEHLARRFVPELIYKWFKTAKVVAWLGKYYKMPKDHFTYGERNKRWEAYLKKNRNRHSKILDNLITFFKVLVWLIFTYNLFQLIKPLFHPTFLGKIIYGYVLSVFDPLAFTVTSRWNIFLSLLVIAFSFRFVRNGLWTLIKNRLVKWIGKDRLELLLRYKNLVRYSDYSGQSSIFKKLKQQYPPDSKFVILPMDMEFMDAGEVNISYLKQMDKLMNLKVKNKETLYPFVFVDPRRIAQQNPSNPFLDIDTRNPDALQLKDCKLKEYLDGGAVGIKIYPALGYYPFDKYLLPLWLYCAQNEIPITTHCSVGPIFYRGDKKLEWDRHPIFEEVINNDANGNPDKIEKLRLQQIKNIDFQANFTHPLNYCCLIEPKLLIKVLEYHSDPNLCKLFGKLNKNLVRDLSKLKINLAHYGGSENWDLFLSRDRQQIANEILFRPKKALQLKDELLKYANLYTFWHYTDWFSIISSMIIEFDNVYTDISYTVHETKYLNLLSEIMNRPEVEERILYGTDFFVVSNQKADKQYWIDMKNILSTRKWYMLANRNPNRFLTSKVCPAL